MQLGDLTTYDAAKQRFMDYGKTHTHTHKHTD